MPRVVFSGPEQAVSELLLLMTYPDDDELRASAQRMLQMAASAKRAPDELFQVRGSDLLLVLRAPGLADVERDHKERVRRGFVAGQLLATLYLMNTFRSDSRLFEPSMRRAIFATSEMAKGKVAQPLPGSTAGKFGDGKPMPTSESTIKDAWRCFAPVSPFWGALRLNGLGYPYAPHREVFAEPHFTKFLEVSNALHRFGTTFVPERARPPVPLLNRASTYSPPRGTGFAELKSEGVPDALKRVLRNYRAPTKK